MNSNENTENNNNEMIDDNEIIDNNDNNNDNIENNEISIPIINNLFQDKLLLVIILFNILYILLILYMHFVY